MRINKNLVNCILITIFIFPIIFKFREFYLVSFLSIPFIIYNFMKYKPNIINRKLFNMLIATIVLYSIYVLVITIYIDKQYMLYSLNKCITLFLFLAFLVYLSNRRDVLGFTNILMYLIVITSFISIIMYMSGVDGINLTLKPKIITQALDLQYYGERRITWMYEHKIQFSATCLIGAFYIAISNISVFKKIIFQLILIISIILSNSKMALPLVVLIIIISIVKKMLCSIKNTRDIRSVFKQWLKTTIVVIILFLSVNLFNNIISDITKTRDISTLGQRSIIWNLAVNDIKNNKVGLIKTYGKTLNNGWSMYSTGHNQILNEFLETGIIGGMLLIFIMIIPLFLIRGIYCKIIYLIVVFLAQFDFLITGLFGYVFWIFVASLIVMSSDNWTNRRKNEKNN